MLSLFRNFKMKEIYLPKLPGLAKSFYVHLSLLKKYMPKLHAHLL